MKKPSNPYFSTTVEKSLTILGLFDVEHTRRSLAEISRLTGINKPIEREYAGILSKLAGQISAMVTIAET